MPTPVTPADFAQIHWRGHWAWVPEEPVTPSGSLSAGIDPHAPEAHELFRKTVSLASVPDRVPARVTADSRYALFVNGQEVYRGSIRSQPQRMYYDLFDLAPFLQPGEKVISIYVKYYGTPKSYWMPAVPHMALGKTGILVFEANLHTAGWLVSDSRWKARKADAWNQDWRADADGFLVEGVPIEVFDVRRFPHSWREAAFDDSGWGNAQVVPAMHNGGIAHTQLPNDPYDPLYPRPIVKQFPWKRAPTPSRSNRRCRSSSSLKASRRARWVLGGTNYMQRELRRSG